MTTQTKYTPGPWKLVEDQGTVILGKRRGKSYSFTVAETFGYQEEREANAQLIASATILYEFACKMARGGNLDAQKMLDSLNMIMQGIIGRPLLSSEDVHHKDGNKLNNDPKNLELINHSEHSKLTNKNRNYKKGYKMNISDKERKSRSLRAIAIKLNELGRQAKAEGKS